MQTQTHPRDLNRDPLTGEPGSHPVGTGLGAVGGAAAGAALGSAAGPPGTLAGGVIGAIAGGLAGKSVAEAVDPTLEDHFWRANYDQEPYYDPASSFDDYGPAYRNGYIGYTEYPDRSFNEAEPALRASWERAKGKSRLTWEKAKEASRAAWDRVEQAIPGDSDGDGK